jgi:hypothetical protein
MFRSKNAKERQRFYLLPGQGGPALRRKRRMFLKWSVVVGLIVSAILAAFLYWINRPMPF